MSKNEASRDARKAADQWVLPHSGGWAVKGEGNIRATKVTKTQREAIDAAIEIAKNQGSDVIVQQRSGQVRLRQQSEQIKRLLSEWDDASEDTPDEWWEDLDNLLNEQQSVS